MSRAWQTAARVDNPSMRRNYGSGGGLISDPGFRRGADRLGDRARGQERAGKEPALSRLAA
jgi:hypothetical protein